MILLATHLRSSKARQTALRADIGGRTNGCSQLPGSSLEWVPQRSQGSQATTTVLTETTRAAVIHTKMVKAMMIQMTTKMILNTPANLMTRSRATNQMLLGRQTDLPGRSQIQMVPTGTRSSLARPGLYRLATVRTLAALLLSRLVQREQRRPLNSRTIASPVFATC